MKALSFIIVAFLFLSSATGQIKIVFNVKLDTLTRYDFCLSTYTFKAFINNDTKDEYLFPYNCSKYSDIYEHDYSHDSIKFIKQFILDSVTDKEYRFVRIPMIDFTNKKLDYFDNYIYLNFYGYIEKFSYSERCNYHEIPCMSFIKVKAHDTCSISFTYDFITHRKSEWSKRMPSTSIKLTMIRSSILDRDFFMCPIGYVKRFNKETISQIYLIDSLEVGKWQKIPENKDIDVIKKIDALDEGYSIFYHLGTW